ncbi:MAG: rhomboid family intramembrane serine protease [Oligosphaeraceae bacterium]|nr:rhomboid family intramembrane serine protease [Oligosphaeraceae bacterium]
MLTCPKCQAGLEKRLSDKGVFWHCVSCDGRAATLPLLRQSVQPEFLRALWVSASQESSAAHCRCPFCNRPMAEVPATGISEEFFLDICTACHLVWFDLQEFQALPQKSAPAVEAALPAAAREKLALLKMECIQEHAESEWGGGHSVSIAEWWQWLPGTLGMPVETASAATKGIRPWGTWGLTILIALISIAAFFDLENAVERFGLIPADYGRYGGMTVITSFFLHAGVIHLLVNLYFLCIFGDNVEEFLGKRRFFLLLLTAVLLGSTAHVLWHPDPQAACIGASGGLSGVLAFYALQFPQARLRMMLRVCPRRYRWFAVPVWLLFLFWVLLQMLNTYLQVRGMSSISALAHLGGTLGGVLFWLAARNAGQIDSTAIG